MSYTHLTSVCRGQIQALFVEGKSMRYIAKALGRAPSTISRELGRNSAGRRYDAHQAQRYYEQRRVECRPRRRLAYRPLWDYVFEKVPAEWTPEQVAGRLVIDYPDDPRMRISYEALYQAIYRDERMHCLISMLPQGRPKRRTRGQGKTRRGPSIPHRVGIEHRPSVVEERSRFGDWEGDTVVGANQGAFITTMVERRSLLLRMRKTSTKQAHEVAQAVIDGLIDMPVSWVRTITFDNGSEFAAHDRIAQVLPITIYFAAPYACYQRGTNENTNGLLRRYLPKGTDLRNFTQHQLDQIADELNNRPRKKLAYRTPNEVFNQYRLDHRVALSL